MVKTSSMSTADITDNTEMAENVTIADVMKSPMRIERSINVMKDDLGQIRSEMEKLKTVQNTKLLFLSHYIVDIRKEMSTTRLENKALKESNKSMNDR